MPYYGHSAIANPAPSISSSSVPLTTLYHINAMQPTQAATAGSNTAAHSSSECICSGVHSANITSGSTNPACGLGNTASISTSTAAQLQADPVLLQQFIQTQQMLINSVCQCNQMLWHQQKEIDNLNNTIHVVSFLEKLIFSLQ